MVQIYPSLMVVDPQDLTKEIDLLRPLCSGFHLDIMDGIFVVNRVWYDAQSVNEVAQIAQKVWIHLMVQKPDIFYAQLDLPADSLISFHIESEVDFLSLVKTIREKKHRVGIAIRPKTPIENLNMLLNVVDQVLVMSVEPGFSGQPFLNSSLERIIQLVAYRRTHKLSFRIGVDGGVTQENIYDLVRAGMDDCAIATGIFETTDHRYALAHLQQSAVREKI